MRTLVTHSSPGSIPSEKEKGHSHGDMESGGSHPADLGRGHRSTASCRHVVLLGLHPDPGPVASAAPVLLPPFCLWVLLYAASSQPRRILHITGPSRHCPLALLMLTNDLWQQPSIHPSLCLSVNLSIHLTSMYIEHPTQALVPTWRPCTLSTSSSGHTTLTSALRLSVVLSCCPHAHSNPPSSTSPSKLIPLHTLATDLSVPTEDQEPQEWKS